MRKIAILLLLTFTTAFAISCGNNNKQVQDKADAYRRAEEERNRELGYTPAPEPVKGPAIKVDSLEEGTSGWVAGQFAMALADMDSSAAMSYCNDTTRVVVKALFLNQAQVDNMQRAKEHGFKIKSVSITNNPIDSDLCTACITATIDTVDVEDCSFHLRLEKGQWKIYKIGP